MLNNFKCTAQSLVEMRPLMKLANEASYDYLKLFLKTLTVLEPYAYSQREESQALATANKDYEYFMEMLIAACKKNVVSETDIQLCNEPGKYMTECAGFLKAIGELPSDND
jgi:hypothetical protein